MKYRLKKDLPDLEFGEIFDDTDSFGHENGSMFDSGGVYRFEKDNIKNFDEWFEVVDVPKYLRKPIKELNFSKNDEVEIVFRFIKDWYYYYYDEVASKGMFNGYDEGTVERLKLGKKNEVFAIGIAIKGLNQMVDDGYIEIEDSPNIVWRDE